MRLLYYSNFLGSKTIAITIYKTLQTNTAMDKLNHYRNCIQAILTKHGKHKSKREDVEIELIFDTTHDHYQLMYIG